MEEYDLKTLSRFPFLIEASEYIKGLNLTIEKVIENIAYRSAWTRGKLRINEAIELGEIQDHGSSTQAEYLNELLSYVIARIITSCISEPYLVRRYALAEAVYAYKGLKESNIKFIINVAKQFNLEAEIDSDTDLKLKFVDYLRYSTSLRAPEYKLVNREVQFGFVKVTGRELSRLIQEALRLRIQHELPVTVNEHLIQDLKPKLNDLITLVKSRKQKFDAKDLGKVSIIRFPPCMKQLLGMTQAGENVPHVGRFALAAFMHHIGLNSEQILKLFSTSPDFDVNKARYQVEHVTGQISGTEYTPPGCSTMKSNGICYNPDTLCQKEWLNHPLTYYRIKGKKFQKKEKK